MIKVIIYCYYFGTNTCPKNFVRIIHTQLSSDMSHSNNIVERVIIWNGDIEWKEKLRYSNQRVTHSITCSVSSAKTSSGIGISGSDSKIPFKP